MSGKLFLLGLLILAGGIVTVLIGNSVRKHDQLLKSWPTVQGRILSSSIVRTSRARVRMGPTLGGGSPEPTYIVDPVWALAVDFRYSVNGVEYIGHNPTSSLLVEKIQSAGTAASREMHSIAEHLPAGSDVAVHYNPRNPGQGYVTFIDDPQKAKLFRVGWICFGIGLVLAIGSRFL